MTTITKRLIKVPLTFPLPSRNWKQGPNGLWHSEEWTPEEKQAAELARYKWRRV